VASYCVFFGNDGELMSIKWKFIKTVFRYTVDSPAPAIQSGYIKPQLPMMYDLSSDPHEDSNLFYTDLTNSALLAPSFKAIIEYERSLKQYPTSKSARTSRAIRNEYSAAKQGI
jgi:hypothetical protein